MQSAWVATTVEVRTRVAASQANFQVHNYVVPAWQALLLVVMG